MVTEALSMDEIAREQVYARKARDLRGARHTIEFQEWAEGKKSREEVVEGRDFWGITPRKKRGIPGRGEQPSNESH